MRAFVLIAVLFAGFTLAAAKQPTVLVPSPLQQSALQDAPSNRTPVGDTAWQPCLLGAKSCQALPPETQPCLVDGEKCPETAPVLKVPLSPRPDNPKPSAK